jgi:hypothetical protein
MQRTSPAARRLRTVPGSKPAWMSGFCLLGHATCSERPDSGGRWPAYERQRFQARVRAVRGELGSPAQVLGAPHAHIRPLHASRAGLVRPMHQIGTVRTFQGVLRAPSAPDGPGSGVPRRLGAPHAHDEEHRPPSRRMWASHAPTVARGRREPPSDPRAPQRAPGAASRPSDPRAPQRAPVAASRPAGPRAPQRGPVTASRPADGDPQRPASPPRTRPGRVVPSPRARRSGRRP